MPQLLKIFPQEIDTFIDLFTGGGDVSANVTANHILANDINTPVIEILQDFQKYSLEDMMKYINGRIEEFDLSKTNEEGYLKYRALYNTAGSGYDTPLDLFTITRFSFNQIIRFNNKMEFNAAFGKNRSSYNDNMRNNTIAFHPRIQDVNFNSMDFRKFDISSFGEKDFLYADPPYLIANADYNNGKTAKLSWNNFDEEQLYKYLDKTNKNNLKFALSNFIKYKDKVNNIIEDWANDNKYNIYQIHSDYSKLTTKAERSIEPTIEVVITNYNINEEK